jgi:hypothetical protein
MVAELLIHVWNTIIKPLAIVLSGVGQRLQAGGNLTNVQCKELSQWIPLVQSKYPNKNREKMKEGIIQQIPLKTNGSIGNIMKNHILINWKI